MLISPRFIRIKPQQWSKILIDVQEKYPEEACGLILGIIEQENYKAVEVYPTTNQSHSTTRYQIDPYEMLRVFHLMEEKQMELVAIYHSHPKGPNTLSQTDIKKAYYPESIYILLSKESQEWQSYAFIIQEGLVKEIPILIDQPS